MLASDDFESAEVEGVRVWWLPDGPERDGPERDGPERDGLGAGLLLSTFDEAWLSHDRPRFPRLAGHRLGTQHLNPAEAGGGPVLVRGRDVGMFKRTIRGDRVEVVLDLAAEASRADLRAAAQAAGRLAAFLGCELRLG